MICSPVFPRSWGRNCTHALYFSSCCSRINPHVGETSEVRGPVSWSIELVANRADKAPPFRAV